MCLPMPSLLLLRGGAEPCRRGCDRLLPVLAGEDLPGEGREDFPTSEDARLLLVMSLVPLVYWSSLPTPLLSLLLLLLLAANIVRCATEDMEPPPKP